MDSCVICTNNWAFLSVVSVLKSMQLSYFVFAFIVSYKSEQLTKSLHVLLLPAFYISKFHKHHSVQFA